MSDSTVITRDPPVKTTLLDAAIDNLTSYGIFGCILKSERDLRDLHKHISFIDDDSDQDDVASSDECGSGDSYGSDSSHVSNADNEYF